MAYIPPRPGQFRNKLRVERREAVSDGGGGIKQGDWTPIAEDVAARVLATKGGEEVRAERLSGISTFDIAIRASKLGITSGDRLVDQHDGTVYNIKWVGSLDGKSRYLNMIAETGGLVDGS